MNASHSSNRLVEFRELLEATSELVQSHGIDSHPYRSPTLERFSHLTLQKQQDALLALRHFYSIMKNAATNTERASHRVTAGDMIERLGWRAPDIILDLLENDMMVEIYNRDAHQVFRNVQFFALSKHSIEEICTVPWFELYERDAQTTTYMLELNRMLLANEITGTMSYLLPRHEVRDSDARLATPKIMGPLFLTPLYPIKGTADSIAGFLSVFRIG